jgi:hypothetical protein
MMTLTFSNRDSVSRYYGLYEYIDPLWRDKLYI